MNHSLACQSNGICTPSAHLEDVHAAPHASVVVPDSALGRANCAALLGGRRNVGDIATSRVFGRDRTMVVKYYAGDPYARINFGELLALLELQGLQIVPVGEHNGAHAPIEDLRVLVESGGQVLDGVCRAGSEVQMALARLARIGIDSMARSLDEVQP